MRRYYKILLLSCSCIFLSGVDAGYVQAAMDLETEAPVAGVSVMMNNYYAGSLHPEEELAAAFASDKDLTQVVKSSKETAVPVVKASKSAYENVAISKVSNYVNVRVEANTTSTITGKIYNNCAATILATVDGEGGKWYQIQSGTVKGYIKAQYFITGAEAETIARKVGTSFARVSNTSTLRLREKPSLDSKTLDLLSPDAEYEVVGEEGDFAKVAVDTDLVGYVFKDYITIRVEFNQAVSAAEEAAKDAEAAKLKQEADDAIKKLEETKKEAAKQQSTAAPAVPATTKAAETKQPETSFNGTIAANPAGGETAKAPETKAPQTTKAPETQKAPETTKAAAGPGGPGSGTGPGGGSGGTSSEVVSATRTAVAAYAKQFLGNPYVYGGTSLTNGADCSGYTQGVYAHFGIATGRTSRDQAANGREISPSAAQPGDLLFYASGNYINHVAMYIGNGQVIHASTSNTGIIISPSNYRTPCKAVSFLD